LTEPVFPPAGTWILCGFGRFGRAIHERLTAHRFPVTVVAEGSGDSDLPPGSVVGRGTEAVTLVEAGIEEAVGIIAGTDHDVNNLSIILTARQLKPSLFTIARQEFAHNNLIFSSAGIDLVTNHSRLISGALLSLITTPLTADFLRMASEQPEEWARILVCRLIGCVDDQNPSCWVITLRPERTPAVMAQFDSGTELKLHHLMRYPENRKKKLPCVALLLQRGRDRLLLPDEDLSLEAHDRILFAGNAAMKSQIQAITTSPYLLEYVITGANRPRGSLLRWFRGINSER
jgi:Trk K+ transport system NAD-binding subunit